MFNRFQKGNSGKTAKDSPETQSASEGMVYFSRRPILPDAQTPQEPQTGTGRFQGLLNGVRSAAGDLNMMSFLWLLLCLRLLLPDGNVVANLCYYALWALAVLLVGIRLYRGHRFRGAESKLISLFAFLCILQIIGLIQIFTAFSVKNIIATVCICCYISTFAFTTPKVQISAVRVGFYPVLVNRILQINARNYEGNVPTGYLMFIVMAYAVAECVYAVQTQPQREKKDWLRWCVPFALLTYLAIGICWGAGSRTAALTGIVSIVFFGVFLWWKPNAKKLEWFFWIFALLTVIATCLYINIRYLPGFEELNQLSNKVFGKNLDSGRPMLWGESLQSLNLWQWIVGAGTGKLPDIERYASSSFHNSYIQLLMQNGLVGLSVLVAIHWFFWKRLARYGEDWVIKLILACFVGIIVYNCFECTLLQNKALMGIIEWSVLALGIVRIRQLRSR